MGGLYNVRELQWVSFVECMGALYNDKVWGLCIMCGSYSVGTLYNVWGFCPMCGGYSVGALYNAWELCIMCGWFV